MPVMPKLPTPKKVKEQRKSSVEIDKPQTESKTAVFTSEMAKTSDEDLSRRPSVRRKSTYAPGAKKPKSRLNHFDNNDKPPIILAVETPYAGKNRLIKVMGTNKVKLMNRSYNQLLYKRLAKEEVRQIENKIIKRENIEHQRLHNLVIKGELEPDETMCKHPIVRVNQTLRRLDNINKRFFELGTVSNANVPPITPIEPFENDLNGRSFKSYDYHKKIRRIYTVTHDDGDDFAEVPEMLEGKGDEEGKYEDVEMKIIYDKGVEELGMEPEVTDSEEEDEDNMASVPIRSYNLDVEEEETPVSIVVQPPTPPKQTLSKNSFTDLFDENSFLTKSLQNIVRDFNEDISTDKGTLREFLAIVRAANYKDSFVEQLETLVLDQTKIFQLANKITKFYERKQKTADDKMKKVMVGDFFGRVRSM